MKHAFSFLFIQQFLFQQPRCGVQVAYGGVFSRSINMSPNTVVVISKHLARLSSEVTRRRSATGSLRLAVSHR